MAEKEGRRVAINRRIVKEASVVNWISKTHKSVGSNYTVIQIKKGGLIFSTGFISL